jgi:hypothetical protein
LWSCHFFFLFMFQSDNRFFVFGGPTRKKPSTTSATTQGQGLITQVIYVKMKFVGVFA